MIPFQKMVKIPRQKIVPFQSEKGHSFSTKKAPFQKRVKIPQKNGTISEEGQTSSTKMVPFQKCQNSSTKMIPLI